MSSIEEIRAALSKAMNECCDEDDARNLLAALRANGLRVVPEAPTEEMEYAADEVFHRVWKEQREKSEARYGKVAFASVSFSVPIWKAMLAAIDKEPER